MKRLAGTAAGAMLLLDSGMAFAAPATSFPLLPWWAWPMLLFAATFLMGIIAVVGGIGGGVLFVPIVGGFFPFHLVYVRGAGLMLALCAALSSAPGLLRSGLASLRLAMPIALAGSIGGVFGAVVGLALPTNIVQLSLGIVVLLIAGLMWWRRDGGNEPLHAADRLALALGLQGRFHDPAIDRNVDWTVHNTGWGILTFFAIGIVGGLFGLGAGWANGPALNLLMGVPIKLALATSGLTISIANSSAAWVYMNKGALMPVIIVPSILGVMIGARVGVHVLRAIRPSTARKVVIGILVLAGLRSLSQGLGW